jgi:hypothetical protein
MAAGHAMRTRRLPAAGALLATLAGLACSSGSGGAGGPESVLERSAHPSRDGHFIQPTLTKAAAARMALDKGFKATFTGAMYASPLFLEKGPGGKGVFFAVTTGNDVFALDETTGAVVWTRNIGPSPTANGVACGSIHPLGILSTPVIDAQARTIYVAGAVGTTMIDRHEVHALSVDDGSERKGWPVDVSKLSAGALPFMPPPQNQRSALSLVGGVLYIAYGGHVGDCGPYHGWVVAIDTKNPTRAGAWATGGIGEGIWAPGGMASDGSGVFAVTGNATSGTTAHLDSEEVVHLRGLATLDRSGAHDLYFPARWQQMDAADADFASSSPVYVAIPGSTPETYVVALSKDGHMYLLDSKNLGGMNGHVVDFVVGTGLFTAPAAYTTATGVHLAFWAGGVTNCPVGPSAPALVSVLLAPGAPPQPRAVWCAMNSAATSPIVTTTDGKSEAIVWYMDNNQLNAVDGETGTWLFNSAADTCGVRPWTSPIAVKGRIVVGGDGHLCSWSAHEAF